MLQINSCTLVEIELTFKRHVLPSNYEPPFKGGFFLLFCKKITRISAGKTFYNSIGLSGFVVGSD